VIREARLQDTKNRQNSFDIPEDTEDDRFLKVEWERRQQEVIDLVNNNYKWAIDSGIAKECARVILPEGNTMSYMYANATVRSWITYLNVRDDEGVTQKEHVYLAKIIKPVLVEHFPFLIELIKEK
jgi:thymidylate synthase (FAD)